MAVTSSGVRRAVFLDKDGTLIENVPYNVHPGLIRLAPGAAEGLLLLAQAGFELLVVSNQSGVARGLFQEDALLPVKSRLSELFGALKLRLAGFYYCPHSPDAVVNRYRCVCDCRKPQPGLILDAAERHALDLTRSWLIGDILDDVEAGNRAGCSTVLVDHGDQNPGPHLPAVRRPNYAVANFAQAARVIIARELPVACGPRSGGITK